MALSTGSALAIAHCSCRKGPYPTQTATRDTPEEVLCQQALSSSHSWADEQPRDETKKSNVCSWKVTMEILPFYQESLKAVCASQGKGYVLFWNKVHHLGIAGSQSRSQDSYLHHALSSPAPRKGLGGRLCKAHQKAPSLPPKTDRLGIIFQEKRSFEGRI